MSYTNIMMISATIPSYNSSSSDGKKGNVADGEIETEDDFKAWLKE